jgi:hypothetical protein
MIIFYNPEHTYNTTDESAFHTIQSNNIKIPKLYLDAISDPYHIQE